MHTESSRLLAYERELVEQFKANPVGLAVELGDGTHAEVSQYRDTPRGRWLRLKSGSGPWVRETEVVAVCYTEVKATPRDRWASSGNA